MEEELKFGNRFGDQIMLDTQQRLTRLESQIEHLVESSKEMKELMREQIRQTAVLEDMIKRQTALGTRVGDISERLTELEAQFESLAAKVNANSEEINKLESPEQYLHKKSYNFLVAAGAAIIGVIISKMGAIIDWFRGL